MIFTGKLLRTFVLTFTIASAFLISGFTYHAPQPARGNVEGYVFPKESKTRVVIAVPRPQHPEDTVHRIAIPDAKGYFKFTNIPEGMHRMVYYPKDQAKYKSKSKMVSIVALQTTNAGSETLEMQ
jgi:hypothetical protein